MLTKKQKLELMKAVYSLPTRSCSNCQHFKKDGYLSGLVAPICLLNNKRIPEKVLEDGCNAHAEEIPF